MLKPSTEVTSLFRLDVSFVQSVETAASVVFAAGLTVGTELST